MNKTRLLIIEDDQAHSLPLSELLEYRGYEVKCARDWDEASEALQSFKPAIVIVDLLLAYGSVSSGFNVIKKLRASEYSRVGIIAWTGMYKDGRDEILALRSGADDFIKKGTETGVIEERVAALARRVKRRRLAVDTSNLLC